MKNYKVKVTRFFTDKIEHVERNVNDEFMCTKERYEFLKENNAVLLIEVIEEKTEETKTEEVVEKPKKNSKKKSK